MKTNICLSKADDAKERSTLLEVDQGGSTVYYTKNILISSVLREDFPFRTLTML